MDTLQESEYIHEVMERLLNSPHGIWGLSYGVQEIGYTIGQYRMIQARMRAEGLINVFDGVNGSGDAELTPLGVQIARKPGGYKGHLIEQWHTEEEARREKKRQLHLDTMSAVGTRDAANASIRSFWTSIAGTLIAAVGFGYSVWTAQESKASDVRLATLQEQVQQMSRRISAQDSLLHSLASRHPTDSPPKSATTVK